MPSPARRGRIFVAYNPSRWVRSVSAYSFRCEGVDSFSLAPGHRDDIPRGAWFLHHAEMGDDGGVVWMRACAACGLEIIARSNDARAYVPPLPKASVACSRTDEPRDKFARCRGERLLLCEVLRIAFRDLESPEHGAQALAWFQGDLGRFTFGQVARYLALDAEALRLAAERVCLSKTVAGKNLWVLSRE